MMTPVSGHFKSQSVSPAGPKSSTVCQDIPRSFSSFTIWKPSSDCGLLIVAREARTFSDQDPSERAHSGRPRDESREVFISEARRSVEILFTASRACT